MRVKLLTTAVAVLVTAMLAIEVTPAAAMAQNSNASTGNKAHHRRARAKGKSMHGVPRGVGECIEHLQAMAKADPLIAYEGHPQEIVNNGLLWNNPKSHCSVGDNQQLRDKIVDAATAWQQKDAAKVRSLLDEAKAAAPSGEAGEAKPAPHRRTRKKASNANAAK